MAYQQIGFDEFMNRIEPSTGSQSQELDPTQADLYFQQFSGNKINGGQIISPDGRVNMNLDDGNFKVNNGVQDLVQLGLLEDGTIGLLLKDADGNILMQVAEGVMFLQSPKKTSRLDLILDQYTVSDEAGNVKVLLGKDVGGF
jgi:hypothetical protein